MGLVFDHKQVNCIYRSFWLFECVNPIRTRHHSDAFFGYISTMYILSLQRGIISRRGIILLYLDDSKWEISESPRMTITKTNIYEPDWGHLRLKWQTFRLILKDYLHETKLCCLWMLFIRRLNIWNDARNR